MLLEDCFEVKLTLRYFLSLVGTSKSLIGQAGLLGDLHTPSLWLIPTPFTPRLQMCTTESLTLRNVHCDRNSTQREDDDRGRSGSGLLPSLQSLGSCID